MQVLHNIPAGRHTLKWSLNRQGGCMNFMDFRDFAAGANWFIDNFVVNPSSQNFVRLANNLITPTPAQRKNLLSYRARNKRNDFEFVQASSTFMLIIPKSTEAAWAKGVIFYDEIMRNFRFVSGDVMLDMSPKVIVTERE